MMFAAGLFVGLVVSIALLAIVAFKIWDAW